MGLRVHEDLYLFIYFWRSPDFEKKMPQFDSRLVKIWVKFVYCCFKHSKKPPPPLLRNPGYAPDVVLSLIHNFKNIYFPGGYHRKFDF